MWKPPAACHDEPEVNSDLSINRTSFHPAFAKWYKTEHPTTPPPITIALYLSFILTSYLNGCYFYLSFKKLLSNSGSISEILLSSFNKALANSLPNSTPN